MNLEEYRAAVWHHAQGAHYTRILADDTLPWPYWERVAIVEQFKAMDKFGPPEPKPLHRSS